MIYYIAVYWNSDESERIFSP